MSNIRLNTVMNYFSYNSLDSSPIFSDESLLNLIKEKSMRSACGAESFFIPLNNEWALKVIRSSHYSRSGSHKECRDKMYRRQYEVYNIGYAPKVGQKVNIIDEDKPIYGYITQIADTAPSVYPLNASNEDIFRFQKLRKDFRKKILKNSNILYDIVEEIKEKTGWFFADSGAFNWGTIDDKFVVIDFGGP